MSMKYRSLSLVSFHVTLADLEHSLKTTEICLPLFPEYWIKVVYQNTQGPEMFVIEHLHHMLKRRREDHPDGTQEAETRRIKR